MRLREEFLGAWRRELPRYTSWIEVLKLLVATRCCSRRLPARSAWLAWLVQTVWDPHTDCDSCIVARFAVQRGSPKLSTQFAVAAASTAGTILAPLLAHDLQYLQSPDESALDVPLGTGGRPPITSDHFGRSPISSRRASAEMGISK